MTRSSVKGVSALGMILLLALALEVRADDLTQSIRVSPDGHFLARSDGKPFFWLGDTAGSAPPVESR